MKRILGLVLLLVCLKSSASDTLHVGTNFASFWSYKMAPAIPYYTDINSQYRWLAGAFTRTLHVPTGGTAALGTNGWRAQGAIYYDSTGTDSGFYVLGSGGVFQKLANGTTAYTNLTQFVAQTNWRLFYSNGSGDVTELALGTSGQFLQANGTTSAPTWATPAGTNTLQQVTDLGATTTNDITLTAADLYLSHTTTASQEGVVYKNSVAWIHDFTPTGYGGFARRNIWIGENAGNFTMTSSGSTGASNIGIGYEVLRSNTTGLENTGIGVQVLYSNTEGADNVALGNFAGFANTTGSDNTYLGYSAGTNNETGSSNVYVGFNAGGTATGSLNTLVGHFSGSTVTTGQWNSFFGVQNGAGPGITTGSFNTVIGAGVTGLPTGLDSAVIIANGKGQQRLRINGNGAWSLDGGSTYGTSGQVLTSNGIGALPTWEDATSGVTASSTTTFTNKRWTARVGSTASSGTPTINTDNYDIYKLTAQAANITSMTTNLSGTPVDGDILEVQITADASYTLAWGASFVSTTVTLPTTISTTTLTVILQYYTTSSYGNNKWHCVTFY